AIDSCFVDISGSIVIDASAVNTAVVGTYTVTYNVTDADGNPAAQVDRTVIVEDTTIPTITLVGANPQTIEACGTYTELGATANDPCFGDITGSIIIDASAVNTAVVGTYTVSYNVTDADGNPAAQVDRTVIVEDTTIPTITLVGANPQTIEACGTYTELGATVNDNCFGDISSSIVIDASTVNTAVVGTYTVTYNVTDADGNPAAQVDRTVIVEDTTAPTFNSCPSSVSRNNDSGACGAIVNFTIPTATDNCGTATVTQTDATGLTTGDEFPIGTTILEYTATDSEGNSTICTFSITVTDSEVPTIVCPTAVTVNANANCEATAVTLGTPTTNDNCGVATVTNNLTSQLPLPVGTHTITWTVTDTAGLTATCTQQVTVVDVTPPVLTCPTPSTFYNTDAG